MENTIITKNDLMNPESSIAINLRAMRENIVESMAKLRELKTVYDAMDARLWKDDPITYGEVEKEYCEKMDDLAHEIIYLLT